MIMLKVWVLTEGFSSNFILTVYDMMYKMYKMIQRYETHFTGVCLFVNIL